MEFTQDDMVIMDSLTNEELYAFVSFLEAEIIRHHDAIIAARIQASDYPPELELWEAAIRRHRRDILLSQERINQAIIKQGNKEEE